ncbi:cystatin-like [Sceloporus undulatus]|uniref:cystatin-like n=1 Tax=Sceloporus undulatus TaxID=8520 RepID=UPI001C4CF678|nr:cystatin-like [Sceloporus undulatus]
MAQVGFFAGASLLFSLCLVLLLPQGRAAQEDPPLPGGLVELPISDPEVQKAAALAVGAFNTQSGSDFYYKALEIQKAESQEVEGIKYFLTIEMVKTSCRKKKGYDLNPEQLAKCKVAAKAEQQKYNCEFEIWLNEKKTDAGIQTWRRMSWRCSTTVPYQALK